MADDEQRFTCPGWNTGNGGYTVFDRDFRCATFVDEQMAIQYTAILNAVPQLATSCDSCRPPPREWRHFCPVCQLPKSHRLDTPCFDCRPVGLYGG